MPTVHCTTNVQLHNKEHTSLSNAGSAWPPRSCGLRARAGLHHVRQPVLVALAQQPVSLIHHLQLRPMHAL